MVPVAFYTALHASKHETNCGKLLGIAKHNE